MNQLQDIPHKQEIDRAAGMIGADGGSFQDEKREYREGLAALESAAIRAVLAIEGAHGVRFSEYTLEEEVRCLRDFCREICEIRRTAAWRGRADLAATYRRVTCARGRLASRWVDAPETAQRLKAHAQALATARAASGSQISRGFAKAAERRQREREALDVWEAAGYALD